MLAHDVVSIELNDVHLFSRGHSHIGHHKFTSPYERLCRISTFMRRIHVLLKINYILITEPLYQGSSLTKENP
jgi:hypothetical protein